MPSPVSAAIHANGLVSGINFDCYSPIRVGPEIASPCCGYQLPQLLSVEFLSVEFFYKLTP
jgi:hypothetical protein